MHFSTREPQDARNPAMTTLQKLADIFRTYAMEKVLVSPELKQFEDEAKRRFPRVWEVPETTM